MSGRCQVSLLEGEGGDVRCRKVKTTVNVHCISTSLCGDAAVVERLLIVQVLLYVNIGVRF